MPHSKTKHFEGKYIVLESRQVLNSLEGKVHKRGGTRGERTKEKRERLGKLLKKKKRSGKPRKDKPTRLRSKKELRIKGLLDRKEKVHLTK